MPDEIDEILKYDPMPKAETDPAIIDEILKYDPGVGGTYKPKTSPFKGGTPPISTITGKTEEEFYSGTEEEAGFGAMMKASFVDDPYIKAKIFAQARGIPVTQYRLTKSGELEFKNEQGQWEREISEIPLSKLKESLANIISHPSTTLGTIGAMLGPKGAIVGAMAGETIRKGVGSIVYGEKQTAFGNLTDVGLEGIFALSGEIVGKLLGKSINRFLGRKAKTLRLGGKEIAERLLSPEDHAKALWIKQLAQQHGMELAPHQLYDREGMTNIWKYLRKHPQTSNAVQAFENKLAKQSDKAINKFINDMGGFEKTPYSLGTEIKETAQAAIDKATEARSKIAGPMYKRAFETSEQVDIKPVVEWIDNELSTAKGSVRDNLLKAKKLLEKPDLPKITPARNDLLYDAKGRLIGGTPEVKSYDTSLKGLHDAKIAIDDEIAKAKKARTGNVARNYRKVKQLLLEQMKMASPLYDEAMTRFASKSEPLNRLRASVIGELSELRKDTAISNSVQKLLNIRNMPDQQLLLEAKHYFSPTTWNEITGSYIRDVYQSLRIAEEGGRVLNIPGKMYKALYGNPKQRAILKAAMTPVQYNNFESLMKAFKNASIGVSKESMTAPFQSISEQMGVIPGSKIYRYALFPRQAITESIIGKWNDMLVAGRQAELLDALTRPDVIKKISQLKQLTPLSKKYLETFSVLTALIVDKIKLPEKKE